MKRAHRDFLIVFLVAVTILALFSAQIIAGLTFLIGLIPGQGDGDGWTKPPDDGVQSASNWQISFRDDLNPANAVTPTQCRVLMPDGSVEYSQTLAAGYARFEGVNIEEGQELTVEGDSETNYYNRVQIFRVPNIAPHDADAYPIVHILNLWGMDASSDAGVVTVLSGSDLLFNGTHEEDQLAVTGGLDYEISLTFNWNGATDEWFGCEQYTQIDEDKYTYVPVIKITGSTGVEISEVSQSGKSLKQRYDVDNGDALIAIYQFEPIREDDGVSGDGIATITFTYTPGADSGDTLDITFHDETRLSRAQSGATSQTAVETVATLTTT